MAAAWDNPPLSPLLHQRDGQGGCVGWGPRQRQKGQDGVSGCHCLGPGLGPEPTGSRRGGHSAGALSKTWHFALVSLVWCVLGIGKCGMQQ